jgi:hypothetical protein
MRVIRRFVFLLVWLVSVPVLAEMRSPKDEILFHTLLFQAQINQMVPVAVIDGTMAGLIAHTEFAWDRGAVTQPLADQVRGLGKLWSLIREIQRDCVRNGWIESACRDRVGELYALGGLAGSPRKNPQTGAFENAATMQAAFRILAVRTQEIHAALILD